MNEYKKTTITEEKHVKIESQRYIFFNVVASTIQVKLNVYDSNTI